MKLHVFFVCFGFLAIMYCNGMETRTARKSASCDSPRLLENAELKGEAITFLTSLAVTTHQQETILIAQLEAACRKNDIDKAKTFSEELQQAHAWNEIAWQQRQKDFADAMQAFQQLQQQQLSQSSGAILDQSTRVAAAAAAAGSSEPTETPERRRRAFSLKGFPFSRQSSGSK